MIEDIKKSYMEALKNQSLPEMKQVAKRLMNLLEISGISKTEVLYTKSLIYKDTEYYVEVEKTGIKDEWEWRIYDENNKIKKFGTIKRENVEDVFCSIITNFSDFVE